MTRVETLAIMAAIIHGTEDQTVTWAVTRAEDILSEIERKHLERRRQVDQANAPAGETT